LTKTDAKGNEEWFQSYGGSSYEFASSVSLTKDGGYVIVGSTSSFGAGNYDAYVIKTDAKGNKEWSQTYGGFYNEYRQTIEETENGAYLINVSNHRLPSKKAIKEKVGSVWTLEIDKKGREIK